MKVRTVTATWEMSRFSRLDERGSATSVAIAIRLKMEDLKGRSLMIHAGDDNYSDLPEKGGGGGARIACGVIP